MDSDFFVEFLRSCLVGLLRSCLVGLLRSCFVDLPTSSLVSLFSPLRMGTANAGRLVSVVSPRYFLLVPFFSRRLILSLSF